jgi:ATP-dependent DNA helicase DinG
MAEPSVRSLLATAVRALGGSERPGQIAMAEAVARAMASGEHLLVQAGTGTGKSLAYLVPALLHREPVVVATATIALQAQIVDRDLPRLLDAVAPALGRRPSFAMLKGRRNYLCRHKSAGGIPADDTETLFDPGPDSALGRDVVRLREWATTTRTGDRDELVPGVGDRAWSQVSVSARECVGAGNCPYGDACFAELARARAGEADIVVTNHALLAIDALEGIPVLPEHDVVVVDEAHQLADRVTAVATEELTAGLVQRAVARTRGAGVEEVERLEAAAEALEAAVAELPDGRLARIPDALGQGLMLTRDAARSVQSVLAREKAREGSAEKAREKDAEGAARTHAKAAIDAVFDTAERLLGESAHDVAWVAREPRRGAVLRVAPL